MNGCILLHTMLEDDATLKCQNKANFFLISNVSMFQTPGINPEFSEEKKSLSSCFCTLCCCDAGVCLRDVAVQSSALKQNQR